MQSYKKINNSNPNIAIKKNNNQYFTPNNHITIDTSIPTIIASITCVAINLKNISFALLKYLFINLHVSFLNTAFVSLLKNFNISLVGVALITATIIITIQSSIVVSLGMVGALSIVRFRTAVKDPLDLMFLFWSICTGIVCGAGFAEFAVLLAIVLTIMVLVLNYIPVAKTPMILVINANNVVKEETVVDVVKKRTSYFSIKSRNLTSDYLDLTIELRTKEDMDLVKEIHAI